MKFLLDTCAALWWWQDSPNLPGAVRERISNSRNTIYFSAVSAMEMATKARLGRLSLSGQLARDLSAAVASSGWQELPLSINEAQQAGTLDWPHRDPFDRLLAAQALRHNLVLLTCDTAFSPFTGIKVFW